MENLAQSLKDLGEKIWFDIALDADGTCTLELADGRPLVIQERANLDELDFVSVLGEVPDERRAEVFTALLSANFYWNGTLGATLSWDPAHISLSSLFYLLSPLPASLTLPYQVPLL